MNEMSESNVLMNHLPMRQGTNVYKTPLIEALKPTYFKSEPRTTTQWLEVMRSISESISSANWTNLFPEGISNALLIEYIKDPHGTIEKGSFSSSEIHQLRQPQLIVLFYFLKKLARFENENQRMIRKINNTIAKTLFKEIPLKATPDYGFAVINAEAGTMVNVPKGAHLEAMEEGELNTRKYLSIAPLLGHCITLDSFITARPCQKQTGLVIQEQILPLTESLKPFQYVDDSKPCATFKPSIILQSSLLKLSEGFRVIKLRLVIRERDRSSKEAKFQFWITTCEGFKLMVAKGSSVKKNKTGDAIHCFSFHFNREWPAIGLIKDPAIEENYLQNNAGIKIQYSAGSFQIVEVALKVTVSKLTPSVLRNQDQVIDPQDNYNPFGLDAPPGAVFSFGHPELADRKIKQVKLAPEWVGKPINIDDYYQAYGISQDDFVVAVKSTYQETDSSEVVVLDTDKALFRPEISVEPKKGPPLKTVWDSEVKDPLEQPLCYQLQLKGPGFGHSQYPLLMTNYAISKAATEKSILHWTTDKPVPVNVPYTPQFSKLWVNYESEIVTWSATPSSNALTIIKNAPCGFTAYKGEIIDSGEDLDSACYFGFNHLTLKSAASLYFHGWPGNARAMKAAVHWLYLAEGGWKPMEAKDILFDGTYHFSQAGIFYWRVPEDMVKNNSLMPEGKYWLKLVAKPAPRCRKYVGPDLNRVNTLPYAHSLITLRGIYPNSFPIERQMEINQDTAEKLSAGSKIYFENDQYDLPVSLPVATTEGVAKENELDFWARVFNRVRNRGRMVTPRDFENLILYQFRELILAKCIPRERCSNYVEVVVMLNINPMDLIISDDQTVSALPLVPEKILQQIEKIMIPLASPFFNYNIRLKVSNPWYIPIGFLIQVDFQGGATEAENTVRLYQDLQQFVNPWFFEKHQVPKFGCWFQYGQLLSYLQSKGYIEAIRGIKLGTIADTKLTFPEKHQFRENEIMVLTNPNAIIVVNSPDEYEQLGIGTMIIDSNFYVGD